MATLWGIHNDQPALDLIEGKFISIGWEELGDLREIGHDRETLKARLAATYPMAKPGAIPVWAGVIHRFIEGMQVGDYVVSPNKADRTLNFGRVVSEFYVDEGSLGLHANRRRVDWIRTGVPRADFSPSALHEIGSALTLFVVKTHATEFLAAIGSGTQVDKPAEPSDDEAVDLAEDEPNAERVDSYSRDFVIGVLRKMDAYRFEHFVAGLLTAMGYRAAATQASGDGGVDVIASRDPLGLEPPIIKVQCKRTVSAIGSPDVQKLAGALANGGSELGLFVTLGGYSTDAIHLERTRQNLRLLTGTQLIDLIFEYYESLDPEWKRMLPLRRVYAVDRDVSGA
ncbi:MAG TPA: restriction endonuclease [Acidimicrobiaceae bacterium]|nr:restriction endonuclease [Acidimicrobiaceae bacterium]